MSDVAVIPESHAPALPRGCSGTAQGWAGLLAQCPCLTQHVSHLFCQALCRGFPMCRSGWGGHELWWHNLSCLGQAAGTGRHSRAWHSVASGSHVPTCSHGYTLCSKLHPHPLCGAVGGSDKKGFSMGNVNLAKDLASHQG